MNKINTIGIDEAGRGPLAGPIVAAAIFSTGSQKDNHILSQVDDSKKLSAENREALFNVLIHNFSYSVQFLDNKFIDRYGIQIANVFVVHDALEGLTKKIEVEPKNILSDYIGGYQRYFGHLPISFFKQGESKHKEIAAASIIAKVYRDRLMEDLHYFYPDYNFMQHKGYGTQEHLSLIKEKGPSEVHRKTFLRKI